MQQASTATRPDSPAASASSRPQQFVSNQFVINLCASTTPVALTRPDHAGLKRFTFFVSRRREEGRERRIRFANGVLLLIAAKDVPMSEDDARHAMHVNPLEASWQPVASRRSF